MAPALNKQEDYPVYEDNWQSLEVFLRMRTQWHTYPFGGLQGLDYVALNSVMHLLKIEDTGRVFNDVQTMEMAALAVFAEQQDNGSKKFSNKLQNSRRR